MAAAAVLGVEGAACMPVPPPEESLLGQAVGAGVLAAVVLEEAPGAAMVGELVAVAMEESSAAVMEEE